MLEGAVANGLTRSPIELRHTALTVATPHLTCNLMRIKKLFLFLLSHKQHPRYLECRVTTPRLFLWFPAAYQEAGAQVKQTFLIMNHFCYIKISRPPTCLIFQQLKTITEPAPCLMDL
jgi:hypothetical protein